MKRNVSHRPINGVIDAQNCPKTSHRTQNCKIMSSSNVLRLGIVRNTWSPFSYPCASQPKYTCNFPGFDAECMTFILRYLKDAGDVYDVKYDMFDDYFVCQQAVLSEFQPSRWCLQILLLGSCLLCFLLFQCLPDADGVVSYDLNTLNRTSKVREL